MTFPDREIDHLAHPFRLVVLAILAQLEAEGFRPYVVETARSAERQAELVGKGVSWTTWSLHQALDPMTDDPASLAVDIIDKRHGWRREGRPFFERLAELAERHGCTAGHYWKRPDSAHIQAVPNDVIPAAQARRAVDLSHLRM